MRRPILALTALVACVAAVTTALTVVATDSLFGDDEGSQMPDHRSTVVPDPHAQSLPVLTIEDEERVKDIALGDPRVQAVLEGHEHRVARVGVWNERLELKGGVVDIVLDSPSTVTGEWFVWSSPNCETAPDEDPVLVSYQATYEGLASIHVLVNLQAGSVEIFYPFDGDFQLVGEMVFTGEHQEIKHCSAD